MVKKYVKPSSCDLGALSGAEGDCQSGTTAYGTACTTGPAAQVCGAGTTAASQTPNGFCLPTGGSAANCLSGTTAGGSVCNTGTTAG